MTLTPTIKASITGTLTKTHSTGVVLNYPISHTGISQALANGTADDQADKFWDKTSTLAASAAENWDLSGALTNPFGDTTVFVKVKALLISAAEGNTNDVIVGGHATAAWVGPFGADTDTIAVRPGGCVMFVAPNTGWAVTATTGDLLKVLNGGGTTGVTYTITVLGTSA